MKPQPALAWLILILVLAMAALGYFAARPLGLLLTWALSAVVMLAAIALTGISLGRKATGILIDPLTNTMSLSRLQIVLWTWVILSAFMTLGTARVADARLNPDGYQCPPPAEGQTAPAAQPATCADPLGIQLPPLLWALMGISLTSAVGAPLLKANKAQRTSDQNAVNQERALARRQSTDSAPSFETVLVQRKSAPTASSAAAANLEDTTAVGAVVRRASPAKANFSDVVTGDEVATFGYVDIAKVQNLFFTIVAVATYAVALAGAFGAKNIAGLFAFPDPTPGLVAIIGISHGGYLLDKAVTHSVPQGTGGGDI